MFFRRSFWPRAWSPSPRFGLILVLLAISVGFLTFLILTGLTPIRPTPSIVIRFIGLNGVLVSSLILLIGQQVLRLWRDHRRRIAGSGLHIRLVLLVSLCSTLPALVVAIFASVTLNRGLDAWFSERTRNIVDSAEHVAQIYLNEHGDSVRGDVIFIARDLEQQTALYEKDKTNFGRRIASYAALYGLSGVFIVNEPERRLEASTVSNASISFHPPTPAMFEQANRGELVVVGPGDGNVIQVLVKLNGYRGIYLYVYRLVNPGVIAQLAKVRAEKKEYSTFLSQKQNLQTTFALMYTGLSTVFLLAAIWLGLRFAQRLATPIVGLVRASQRISEGDFDTKVENKSSETDLLTLTNTFNRMTGQLKSQREELLRTNALLDQRRRFTEAVLEGVRAGVIGLDSGRKITLVNPSALSLLKKQSDHLLGKIFAQVLPEMAQVLMHSETGRTAHIPMILDGQERILIAKITQENRESQAEGFGYVVTFDDITDLVLAQRTSAWADIARRIAHEIKNPLTPIQLAAERLNRKYSGQITTDRETFDQCTQTIVRQVEDIGRMVDEFSAFARMPQAHCVPTALGEVVHHSVMLLATAPHILFKNQVPKPGPLLNLDRRLIDQALTNILKNAQESIERRQMETPSLIGQITLSLHEDDTDIFLEVRDNGIGLPPLNRARLKEPYVTTRDKGTGLGLAIVNKIMEEHKGALLLLDSPPQGALIRLVFPKK